MPSDPRKWQACGYGLRDHDNRTAIPGCQSDRNYGDARNFVSYDTCVQLQDRARERKRKASREEVSVLTGL